MSLFLLVRHGHADNVGKAINGRNAGVELTERGRREVRELAERLRGVGLSAVLSSPLERARQTAAPLAEAVGVQVDVRQELNELNYGQWTGKSYAELQGDPRWKAFNSFRSGTRIPGGETMLEVQARVAGLMLALREEYHGSRVAMVSHADTIRAALMHFLGLPLDFVLRVALQPASVSVLALEEWGAELRCLNHTGALPVL
ncbi:fructose-2,6-bisphosphatase [Desulfocurvibacter africanus PCS]|uniref:Fructose-2,6-bisphosphatase n=1 Tax=Desulfocurvibacter africanus PCS TaxID=1262666 RepID=M5PZM3_DESAF|nr:histidine phosphatase family protein [Desulfocurvibacter africanus]EMG35971.1 fructose-2,6-bisphosphatase [Desulfocurvibacter africanus PCS]